MDRHQITLVRDSFALVQPIAAPAAALFYAKLFHADPALRHLFRGDMHDQGARLMTMIGQAVVLLEQPQVLLPVLRSLGKRHVAYGVVDAHYDTVGQALLATLHDGLGEAFTPAVRDAWTACYGVIAATMQAGARDASADAPLELAA
jgi:hemoglobin-like flavoprotein